MWSGGKCQYQTGQRSQLRSKMNKTRDTHLIPARKREEEKRRRPAEADGLDRTVADMLGEIFSSSLYVNYSGTREDG